MVADAVARVPLDVVAAEITEGGPREQRAGMGGGDGSHGGAVGAGGREGGDDVGRLRRQHRLGKPPAEVHG